MNYGEIRLSLKQRSLFEILDLSVLLLKASGRILWPFYIALGALWVVVNLYVFDVKIERELAPFFLLIGYLFFRYFIQIVFVLFFGRFIFSDQVSLSQVWVDLRQIGIFKTIGLSVFRFIKWLIGIVTLIPLWFILIYRFFDYEYWLLERISGKTLSQRLKSFRPKRVIPFRLLHLVLQWVFVGLAVFTVSLIDKTVNKVSESSTSVVVIFSSLLMYEPFFMVSRFLLYIQERIDAEGWDIGLLFEQGIRKSKKKSVIAILLVSLLIFLPSIKANPTYSEDADRPCTAIMQKEPYIECRPTRYRIYSAEEIEKVIPKVNQPRKQDSSNSTSVGTVSNLVIYIGLAILIIIVAMLLWRYYKTRPKSIDAAKPNQSTATEFEVIARHDRLALIDSALKNQDYRTAMGHCYLLIQERNETVGSRIAAFTPQELSRKLGLEFHAFLTRYELVFYANEAITANTDRDLILFIVNL